VAIIGAISLAARRGIIIKNPAALEEVEQCRTLILDKTGTLTYGRPTLTEVLPAVGHDLDFTLGLAASLEQYSKHPLALAVVRRARDSHLALGAVEQMSERPGEGLRGRVNGHDVMLTGRQSSAAEAIADQLPPTEAGLEALVFVDGLFAAALRFRDEPRRDSRSFIQHLRPRHGIGRTLWLSGDRDAYVQRHMFPQFKDLVTRYSPSVIFSDGEWDLPSEQWSAPALLAWLYNESPVAQKVVVNDRWGREGRHRHGGYYTTEYGAGLPGASHPWEENRGIGHSYGFNRNEDLADYATGQQLLLTLLDTVSRGGNLLLNIGPTADGRIPVVMQERLAYLGAWLEHNGEAVYGTRTFREGAQWSVGRKQEVDTSTNYRAKYDVEKLTLNPAAGDARKEILFTRKGETLYAILPRYPRGELTIRNLRPSRGARISLLGSRHSNIAWRQRGGDVVFRVPDIGESELPFAGAHVFRIEGLNKQP
jgi:hypothetical protein